MAYLKRTTSADSGFQNLVVLLDRELAIRDGDEHSFYAQYNKIDGLNHVMLYEVDGAAIACGAFKEFDRDTIEIKRMYVLPPMRGRRIAAAVLSELGTWAAELNYKFALLETGKTQPEAIALYKRCGYSVVPNYGQYAGVENSVCMKKTIQPIA